jgi:putative flippase GtrA
MWTFRDRRGHQHNGVWKRLLQFHLVSLVGAAVQWTVFVAANIFWLVVFEGDNAAELFFSNGAGWFDKYIYKPIAHPPDVGGLKYLSQLLGIGAATLWNYCANFYWTWSVKQGGKER